LKQKVGIGVSSREVWWEFAEGRLAETDRLVIQSNERRFRGQAAWTPERVG